MSTIEKMSILGIRSFSPQRGVTIQFYKPLTLIVGPNGAGKTTIIECLKHACTGALPPDSKKGQTFIHDPKLAGEREVKAQIKLCFKTLNEKLVTVVRNLQLTQRANGKQEYKFIDGSTKTKNDKGEIVSQSFHCADLDKLIPELMGVSKAILENVIFCHQEESNWPLADASQLKKRFDDIFAATRYTKALDVLKKQRKEYSAQIKELDLILKHTLTHRENAHRLRREYEETETKINVVSDEISKITTEINETEKQRNELQSKYDSWKNLSLDINKLLTVKEQMTQQIVKLQQCLSEELFDSDEELKRMLKSFHGEVEDTRLQEKDVEEQMKKLETEKSNVEKRYNQISEEFGKLTFSAEQLKNLREQRDNHIVTFAEEYKIKGYKRPPFSNEQVKNFLQFAEELFNRAQKKIREAKEETQRQLTQITAEIEFLNQQRSQLQNQINTENEKISKSQNELQQIRDEIAQKKTLLPQLSEIEAHYQIQKEQFEKLKKEFNVDEIKSQIQQIETKKTEINQKIRELNVIVQKLTLQSNLRAKVEHLQAEAKKAEEAYKTKLKEVESEVLRRFGEFLSSPQQIKMKTESLLQIKQNELNTLKIEWQNAKDKLVALEGQQKLVEEQLTKHQTQLDEKRQILREVEGAEQNLPQLIEETEKQISVHRSEITKIRESEVIYKTFLNDAKEHRACPLCHRKFDNGFEEFIQKLESFLSEIPNTLTANETNLQNAITLKKKLESLRPHWSRAHSLLTEHVPNLHLQQQKFTNDFREANEILQTKKAALESKNKEVSELEKLLQNTEQILQHFNEFNRFSTAAETEAKNISLTVPESQSLEEITKELTNCQNMSMEYTHTLEELQKEMQLKKENIMSCESNLMQMEKQILQMQNVRQTITQLNRRYEEIQTALQQSQSEVGKLQSQMEATQTAIQEKNRQRESMLIEATAKDEKLQKAKEKFSQSLVKLQLAEQQIQKLSKSSNIEEEISTLTTEKRKLEEKLEQVNAEMKRCSEQLLTLRKLLANKDQLKRNLEDNLRFREEKQKLNEIEQNLNQKKEKLQEYDKNTILENISSLDTRIESLKSKLNQCLGAKNAYLEQLKTQQLELKKPHYIHADDEYRKAFVKLKTTEMIASDLDKYYKALDKALVKYHASKMEEINKIIKDLWQTTYKGDDISTIEIRADSEEASGRRNYNYRVVMLKGDTELDMRGRCSAGQKVLASLIIRLALAEAFCLNCGILALDEPTTNLDRQNMESFAKALVNIIENRRQQQNFQLIIITHDEEFVQLLGRSEHADYYWRVKKDPQSGHSVIVQVPIDNL